MPENPTPEKSKSIPLLIILAGLGLLISALALIAFIALNTSGDDKTTTSTTDNSSNSDHTKENSSNAVVLTSLGGVSFGPYNQTTSISGDFVFAKDAAVSEMILFPFGQKICEQGSCKTLPELGFQGIKLGTKVTAVAAGRVVEVRDQGDNDFAVSTVFEGTNTALNYDHLSNVTAKVGDTLKAGDILGEVAPYGSGKYGRYEIMLKEVTSDNSATYLCPMDYLDSSVKDSLTADLKQFFTDWNTFMGKTVHDLSTMDTPGCLKLKLTEAEVGL